MKRIAITTGDSDGIGFEVAEKALRKIGPKRSHQFILWSRRSAKIKFSPGIKKLFDYIEVRDLDEALTVAPAQKQLIHIRSSLEASEWVRQSALAALSGKIQALCTGPLSKTSPGASGGHTGIFRTLVDHPLFMFFVGSKFNVLLLTDHQPLHRAIQQISEKKLVEASTALKQVEHLLPKKPIGLLGLNPHAGEQGILGHEEQQTLVPFIKKYGKKLKIVGPLVPDAAFFASNWKMYSTYLALYHDQGLIPFKLVHGHNNGTHITLGLPFVRTSVDHGTAKDIFGLNKADPGSMIDALQWAIKLTAR